MVLQSSTVLVGAPEQSGGGAVYEFEEGPAGWTEMGKMQASNAMDGDRFGVRLAIHEDVFVAGAPYRDDAGEDSGAAYVFRRGSSGWTEEAVLRGDDVAAGDWFGAAVAVGRDRILIGAAHGRSDFWGVAYVFERSNGSWNQVAALRPESEGIFAFSVGLSGEELLIADPGLARVHGYARDGGVWRQGRSVQPTPPDSTGFFGGSLATGTDVLVVGAPAANVAGAIRGRFHVFAQRGGEWTETDTGSRPSAGGSDGFGAAVAVHQDTLVVGDVPDRELSGRAYVHALDTDAKADFVQELVPEDPTPDDFFGHSVAAGADVAVIGARYHPGPSGPVGAVYVFRATPTP